MTDTSAKQIIMEPKHILEEPQVGKMLQMEPVNSNIKKEKGKNSPCFRFPFASLVFEDNKKPLKKQKQGRIQN